MGSRKQNKKSRKPDAKDFATAKSYNDSGVYMPAFIFGMVTSIIVILLIWSRFTMSDSASKALAKTKLGDPSSAVEIDPESFESILESGDASQLYTILIGLSDKNDPNQLEFNSRRRVDVSNKLLTLKLSDKQRELAIVSKIDALTKIYGLGLTSTLHGPSVSVALRTTSETHAVDANELIKRTARLSLLKFNAFERLDRDPRPNIEPIAESMVKLLHDYPGDGKTSATIKLIISYYVENNMDEGIVLLKKIKDNSDSLNSTNILAMVQGFSDTVKMQSLAYNECFENRWLNGTNGQKELVKLSLELLEDSDYGFSIVQRVDRTARWFEEDDQYDRAAEIYRGMLGSSELNESPEVATLLRETAEYGLARQKLVNQKIEFSGVSSDGSPINPQEFEQRVVVVLFWSMGNRASIDGLNQVYRETASWRTSGGKILAVTLDSGSDKEFKAYAETMNDVVFVVGDADRSGLNLIWEQCPGNSLPRVMLVDRNGVVVDINVPIKEVKTQSGFLMSQ